MDIIRKDATISATGEDTDFPGTFEVILSAPTLDRDGDTLLADEWKLPLPDKITFDVDHGMSVATTVGSGVPEILDDGRMKVTGSFSSRPLAQETRTLVREGHIDRTSVAFMTEKTTKDGKTTVKRELLNGAFVAIPSNREAVVLSSKAASVAVHDHLTDAEHIQAIQHHALALGGAVAKSFTGRVKAIAGSLEATQERARDALQDAYPGVWVYLRGTIPGDEGGVLVFGIEDPDTYDCNEYKQSYEDDGAVITLTGERTPVDVVEVITPDPDEDAEPTDTDPVPATAAQAPVAATRSVEVAAADSDAVTDEEIEATALMIQAAQFI